MFDAQIDIMKNNPEMVALSIIPWGATHMVTLARSGPTDLRILAEGKGDDGGDAVTTIEDVFAPEDLFLLYLRERGVQNLEFLIVEREGKFAVESQSLRTFVANCTLPIYMSDILYALSPYLVRMATFLGAKGFYEFDVMKRFLTQHTDYRYNAYSMIVSGYDDVPSLWYYDVLSDGSHVNLKGVE